MKHCILFYKYAPLSSDKGVMLLYQNAMRNMCTKLDLTGRVLIGLSDNAEGLNGTLAGDKENVLCYTYALMGKQWCIENKKSTEDSYAFGEVLDLFFLACQEFSQLSNVPIPNVDNLEDFKWSSSDSDEDLFPDLQIKLVKEIISTGGVLSSISIQETSKDYLTPDEWHDEMKKINDEDSETILIDCRNRKEFAVGHFENAIDPNTKIFAQFPKWVQENKSALKDKKVLMYCTGGIRCEKASAFIRNELKDVSSNGSVHHLKGGIHKYLDKFASEGFFRGKNFVFDRRLVMDAKEHKQGDDKESMTGQKSNCVGKCQYCDNHYDSFTGEKVCTVCRENCLVCEDCKGKLNREFHCVDHMHLRDCYFTNLGRFSREELQFQLIELEKNLDQIAVGRKHKQKRQTLYKQCERIQDILSNNKEMSNSRILCRSCGEEKCNGECWGVHGLERQKRIEKERIIKTSRAPRVRANKRPSKVAQKQKENGEIIKLRLSEPPNVHRCNDTGLRCPPPTIRTLSTSVKGKWCGNSIKFVMSSEFHEFAEASRLDEVFRHSLIFIDGVPVNCEQALRRGSETTKALSPDTVLKNMDIITRYQHWHEPPVIVPRHIDVERIELPEIVCNELIPNFNANDDTFLYCCNKPATVPVHPAGPYYQNTLLLMVEAQEGLRTRSLLPCHRLDRCTSGLTICCTNPKIARLIQVQMDLKLVSKMYIARVKGAFPNTLDNCKTAISARTSWSWCENNNCVEVNAPIGIIDIHKGLRGIRENGKIAESRFKLLNYDKATDTSIISCFPITGRQHQLRVHLKAIGFPIHNDTLYGGNVDNLAKEDMKLKSLKSINDAMDNDRSHLAKDDKVTEKMIDEAKVVCSCCSGIDGIECCYSNAQLLMDGHSIDLHALAYRVRFERKENRNNNTEEIKKHKEPIAIVELNVKSPSWDYDATIGPFWLDK